VTWVSLGEPVPHETASPLADLPWPDGETVILGDSPRGPARSFVDVAVARRTRYDFAPLQMDELSEFFALTCRVQQSSPEQGLGFALSRRLLPSAGAIHPIHVVLNRFGSLLWQRYDPYAHALVELPSPHAPDVVRRSLNDLADTDEATVFLFAAEPQRTAAKYANETSLVWRDAGVLLGGMSLAAEALELSFAPLGATGDPWVANLVPGHALAGVGVALLGARRTR
jgi:hypothetical protein